MANNKKSDNGERRRFQQPRRGFNWFSLVYLALLYLLIFKAHRRKK